MQCITVIEGSRTARIKPQPTIQNDDDTFNCPAQDCDGRVPITYYQDHLGQPWPNVGLRCPKCNREYSILL